MKNKLRLFGWTLAILASLVASPAIYFAGRTIWGFYSFRKYLDAREHQLRYKTDYKPLASELRAFATSTRWGRDEPNASGYLVYWPRDPDFPRAGRNLNATSVAVFNDRIEVECGGPFEHFGVRIFRNSKSGYGNANLGDGVWYYVGP